MAPKFGTSGLRGLVSDLTDALVADYTKAFARSCATGGTVFLGRDLRESSPRISSAVAEACLAEGLDVIDCAEVPTPALAMAAGVAGAGAIMVTGSHIPADRNGLKFYTPTGEIGKDDEARILACVGTGAGKAVRRGTLSTRDILPDFANRYVSAFGGKALSGMRVGVYQHSSVARDILGTALEQLGADVVRLGRSDSFIPVDTEALDPDMQSRLSGWATEHQLDAIVSTDGDADRPMVADANGRIVPGDVLGVLTARQIGARHICTPVSSNSMVSGMAEFESVALTRIGSPYVIAAMEAAGPDAAVAGYEANGGFLLGFAAQGPAGDLAPLMTRDCMLPIIAPLFAAASGGRTLADLVAALPQVFTAADRVAGVPTEASAQLIAHLTQDQAARVAFFDTGAPEQSIDLTDGLRVRFKNREVVHLRPSGNAPECRCYAESSSPERARALVAGHLARLRARLG